MSVYPKYFGNVHLCLNYNFKFIFGYFDNFTKTFEILVYRLGKASYSMQHGWYFQDCKGSFILAAARSSVYYMVFISNIYVFGLRVVFALLGLYVVGHCLVHFSAGFILFKRSKLSQYINLSVD